MRYPIVYLLVLIWVFAGCQPSGPLPFIGPSSIKNGDTIYHTIAPFEFVNQNNETVNNENFKDHIYVADFFFTSCPTICPRVRVEMLKIYDAFESHPTVKLVSHTIDPKHDTPAALKKYAENLEVRADKWLFLTGEKEALYDISRSYFVAVTDKPSAPGGIEHSGRILLVDKAGHIRAQTEGTDPSRTKDFIKKIGQLLNEG